MHQDVRTITSWLGRRLYDSPGLKLSGRNEKMSLAPAETDSTEIEVQLSKDQVSAIWPGLNYIIDQFLNWERSGESVTCYPFALRPLPPGSDAGTFSAPMMERIERLWAKIQPIRTTGGRISVGEFELRAAILAARTSVNLERHRIRKAPKKGAPAKRRVARAKRALKSGVRHKERVIEFLERELKRANRRFHSVAGADEFKTRSSEWQSHLRWIQYRLVYFKPLRASDVSRLQIRRLWLDILEQMAEKAIIEEGYALPAQADLRQVIRQFLDYSLRGRMGDFDHIFMTRNSDRSVARLKLLDFVQARLNLQEVL
jgi:hypothetical protein